jgi:hypothetical protein
MNYSRKELIVVETIPSELINLGRRLEQAWSKAQIGDQVPHETFMMRDAKEIRFVVDQERKQEEEFAAKTPEQGPLIELICGPVSRRVRESLQYTNYGWRVGRMTLDDLGFSPLALTSFGLRVMVNGVQVAVFSRETFYVVPSS